MSRNRVPKLMSVSVPGQSRKHIHAIKRNWPFPHAVIVAAALAEFSKRNPDEQSPALLEAARQHHHSGAGAA